MKKPLLPLLYHFFKTFNVEKDSIFNKLSIVLCNDHKNRLNIHKKLTVLYGLFLVTKIEP